jgi:hypothetical protein
MLLQIDIVGQSTPFFALTFPSTTDSQALRPKDCTVNTGILRSVYELHDKWEVAAGMRDISLFKNEKEDERNEAHVCIVNGN